MQLWLRPAPEDRPEPHAGRALVVTAALNLLLLLAVAWRASRTDAAALTVTASLAATVAVFIESREAAIRLTARVQCLRLGHVSWTNGIGLAGALAAVFGVWFPLTGTAARQIRSWSVAAYGAIALLGIGPLVIALL